MWNVYNVYCQLICCCRRQCRRRRRRHRCRLPPPMHSLVWCTIHKSCKIRAIQIFITDFVLKANAIFRQNGIFIRMQQRTSRLCQKTRPECGNGGHTHPWKWFGEIWDEPKSIQIKMCKRYVPIRTSTMANADRQMDWPIFQWGFSIV